MTAPKRKTTKRSGNAASQLAGKVLGGTHRLSTDKDARTLAASVLAQDEAKGLRVKVTAKKLPK